MSSALISSEQALNDYFTALLDEETAEFESTLKPELIGRWLLPSSLCQIKLF